MNTHECLMKADFATAHMQVLKKATLCYTSFLDYPLPALSMLLEYFTKKVVKTDANRKPEYKASPNLMLTFLLYNFLSFHV